MYVLHIVYVLCSIIYYVLCMYAYLPTVPGFPGLSRISSVCPGVQIFLRLSRESSSRA